MDYIQALIYGLALAGGMYLFAHLAGRFGESAVMSRPSMKFAQDVVPRRAHLEHRFENRRADLTNEIGRMNAEIATLRRKRFSIEKDLIDAQNEALQPVRVVGREGSTAISFRAWVVNRQVQNALAEGKTHLSFDASWATPQIIEIWAENLPDARRELQRIYPMPLGFSVMSIKLAQADGGALSDLQTEGS